MTCNLLRGGDAPQPLNDLGASQRCRVAIVAVSIAFL